MNLSFAGTVFAGCIGTMIILINGSSLISDFGMEQWKLQMIDTRPTIDESSFSRIETDSTSTNYEMRWGIPTIHCFLSTVPSQIFDFYEGAVREGLHERVYKGEGTINVSAYYPYAKSTYKYIDDLITTQGCK